LVCLNSEVSAHRARYTIVLKAHVGGQSILGVPVLSERGRILTATSPADEQSPSRLISVAKWPFLRRSRFEFRARGLQRDIRTDATMSTYRRTRQCLWDSKYYKQILSAFFQVSSPTLCPDKCQTCGLSAVNGIRSKLTRRRVMLYTLAGQ
jgi:hypothetical protein